MALVFNFSIFPPEIRGPATYVFNLIKHSINDTFRVVTFTPSPQNMAGVEIASISQKGNMGTRQARLFKKVFSWAKDCDLIYAQGADVVGLASVLVGKFLGKPVVVKFVGDLTIELKRDLNKNNLLAPIATWLSLQLADRVVFPAKHLQTEICFKYQITKKKTVVIYNAVDV